MSITLAGLLAAPFWGFITLDQSFALRDQQAAQVLHCMRKPVGAIYSALQRLLFEANVPHVAPNVLAVLFDQNFFNKWVHVNSPSVAYERSNKKAETAFRVFSIRS